MSCKSMFLLAVLTFLQGSLSSKSSNSFLSPPPLFFLGSAEVAFLTLFTCCYLTRSCIFLLGARQIQEHNVVCGLHVCKVFREVHISDNWNSIWSTATWTCSGLWAAIPNGARQLPVKQSPVGSTMQAWSSASCFYDHVARTMRKA